jgi:hypothetical protein
MGLVSQCAFVALCCQIFPRSSDLHTLDAIDSHGRDLKTHGEQLM